MLIRQHIYMNRDATYLCQSDNHLVKANILDPFVAAAPHAEPSPEAVAQTLLFEDMKAQLKQQAEQYRLLLQQSKEETRARMMMTTPLQAGEGQTGRLYI